MAVRNFVCRIGEDTELLLCLYDAREWKPLTENYVVRWSRLGLTRDLDLLGNLRVLFSDLGSRDLARERLFLVCYVIRVGNMDIRADDPKRGSAAAGGARRTISGAPPSSSPGNEFLRRPCGIACMDVTDYLNGRLETEEEKQVNLWSHFFVGSVVLNDFCLASISTLFRSFPVGIESRWMSPSAVSSYLDAKSATRNTKVRGSG